MHQAHRNRLFPYAEAHEHFAIFFAGSGSSMLHAAPLEGGSAAVWDAKRLSRLHDAMLDPAMLRADHRYLEIAPVMQDFGAFHWKEYDVGSQVFRPQAWPGALRQVLSRGREGGTLVALALGSDLLKREWMRIRVERRHAECKAFRKAKRRDLEAEHRAKPLDEPTRGELLAFMQEKAEIVDGKRDEFFDPLRKWGEKRLETALKAYHEFFWGLHDKALEQERLAS